MKKPLKIFIDSEFITQDPRRLSYTMQNYLRFKEVDYLDDKVDSSYFAFMVVQEYFGIEAFQTKKATEEYGLIIDKYEV